MQHQAYHTTDDDLDALEAATLAEIHGLDAQAEPPDLLVPCATGCGAHVERRHRRHHEVCHECRAEAAAFARRIEAHRYADQLRELAVEARDEWRRAA